MYISRTIEKFKKAGGTNYDALDINNYKQYLTRLTTPEKISVIKKEQNDVYAEGSDIYYRADVQYTDAAFWNIYSFSFLAGKPFSGEEFQSGVPVAVIGKSIARKLFNETGNALGKSFILNKKSYKVIGIVEDVPTLFQHAYAQIWVPYTSNLNPQDIYSLYGYTAVFLAKTRADFGKIKSEVRRSELANNPQPDEKEFRFMGPFSEEEILMKGTAIYSPDVSDPDLVKGRLRFYLTLAILLLIPAINLSGFSLFKMVSRTSEIGIRKAFGADKETILTQVLYENLLTSLIGGVIGLAFSMVAVTLVRDQLFGQNGWWAANLLGENTIPVSAFVSPWIFVYVLLACVVLNLLSSGIPAWRASRLNIVEAIKN
jgi:putative ABC transport system permease protein